MGQEMPPSPTPSSERLYSNRQGVSGTNMYKKLRDFPVFNQPPALPRSSTPVYDEGSPDCLEASTCLEESETIPPSVDPYSSPPVGSFADPPYGPDNHSIVSKEWSSAMKISRHKRNSRCRSSKSRTSKSGRVQKPSKASSTKARPSATAPPFTRLSDAAKTVADELVLDTAAFVHRSTAVRQREVRKGERIKRPHNAYILYRKAYQKVAEVVFHCSNQQELSIISGACWKQERGAIKRQFEEWARIEKRLHSEAFPGYQYTPEKQKKVEVSDESSHSSDPGSPEAATRQGRAKRATSQPRSPRRSFSHFSETPPIDYEASYSLQPSYANDPYGPLYQSNAFMDPSMAFVHPQTEFSWHHPRPVALNSSNGVSMGTLHGQRSMEAYIDPALTLAHVPDAIYKASAGVSFIPRGHQDWGIPALEPQTRARAEQDAYLKGEDDWEVEQLGHSNQFDDWMDQTAFAPDG